LNRSNLSSERIALLDRLNFPWSERELSWDDYYHWLQFYQESEGHCRVPIDYINEAGIELGTWVRKQCANRDKLSNRYISLLQEIGIEWDPDEFEWQEMYRRLEQFTEREGHCHFPASYQLAYSYKLWNWVDDQRRNRIKLSIERVSQLESLGFEWDSIDLLQTVPGTELPEQTTTQQLPAMPNPPDSDEMELETGEIALIPDFLRRR
jgi:hypothetical protein